jgi:hypothetical protein
VREQLLFGNGRKENALAFIEGIIMLQKFYIIYLFQKQLVFKIDENGLENTKLSDIDVIVMHAPGTKKGDLTEYKAIQKLFMKATLINHKQVENRTYFWSLGC